jgi:hypothetical protein
MILFIDIPKVIHNMTYLASPYSHPDAQIREARFQAVCQAAAKLMREGRHVFSPIAHSHPIAAYGLPTDWSYWEASARRHIKQCDELLVLMLDGWEHSIGVQAEIEIAKTLSKTVRYERCSRTNNA